jgi:hypothetical protein
MGSRRESDDGGGRGTAASAVEGAAGEKENGVWGK